MDPKNRRGLTCRNETEVISPVPLGQERFRSAAANRAREEKDLLDEEKKRGNITLIRMLIAGILFIVLGMLWNRHISAESPVYRVIAAAGSFGLGRAVAFWIEKLPENRISRRMIGQTEKNDLIEFTQADPA